MFLVWNYFRRKTEQLKLTVHCTVNDIFPNNIYLFSVLRTKTSNLSNKISLHISYNEINNDNSKHTDVSP